MKRILPFCCPLLLLSLALPVSLPAQDSSEYEIKAAFLYNFAKFVTWPVDTEYPQHNFSLCILGDDPFGGILGSLEGKKIRNETLQVRRITDPEERKYCQILYISSSAVMPLEELLSIIKSDQGLLTVSDAENFARNGGMIELLLEGGKVRFVINLSAARSSKLELSSKLLNLAARVEGGADADLQ